MNLMTTKHGFFTKSTCKLEELDAVLHEMEHEKSGAHLVWLERPDENKTFGIAFRTIPWNDTGVFHILEHSVLCGSDKYPVREPFVELLKGSLNTFLNAMTFPDKTFYPVSSRNDKDFLNLTQVYLDAVFHPLIYSKPEIFAQEGWHYEFDEEGNPSYKGVVFNEMKGAFASADELLQNELNRRLFPDNCYRYVSGGDPAHIPELSYQEFVNGHRKFYHPSNSYIFLDGEVNLDETLALIDEYLREYSRSEELPQFDFQAPVHGGVGRISYELGPDEAAENRCRVGYGYVIGSYQDRETLVAMQVLCDVLAGSNHAPLTRRILTEGIAENVDVTVLDEVLQPWVAIDVQNLEEADLPRVGEILREELSRLAGEGLDHRQLEASLSNYEFKLRERDYGTMPRGLILGMEVLGSWLYGGQPESNLVIGDLFRSLREKMKSGFFEELIRRVFLENPHCCEVRLIPSHTLGDENRAAEAARLNAQRAQWSEAERAELLAQQKRLEAWQSTPDTPEQLATIPHVTLDEIPAEPEAVPMEVEQIRGVTVLKHPINTSGIVYISLYFDLDGLDAEQLSCASFLCRLLGNLETEHYACEPLQNELRLLFGNLSFAVSAYSGVNQPDACKVRLRISGSMLESKLADAIELLVEVASRTSFGNRGLILELLRQQKTGLNQQIVMSGSSYAMNRIAAGVNAASAAEEYLGGISYYRWLKVQEEALQRGENTLLEELEKLYRGAISADRMTVGVTGTMENGAELVTELLLDKLPVTAALTDGENQIRPWGLRTEGFVVPADVSFAALGGSLVPYGGGYSGPMQLTCRVATLEYLWNMIRVQGGAYGTGLALRDDGFACCYSYRDPNGKRSLDCYQQTAPFLRDFFGRTEDLTSHVIGAISDSSPLMTPRVQGLVADVWYWKGVTYEERRANRRALLSAKPEELAALCGSLEQALANGGICIIGSEKQVKACGDLLGQVEAL